MTFHLLRNDEHNFDFAAFTPDNIGQIETPPLLVFLHGSGERGLDRGLTLKGLAHIFENLQLPVAVIFPQCDWEHRAFYGAMEDVVFQSIETAIDRFGVDTERIYLAGYSMGGSSCLWLAAKHPRKFKAILCIAPGITWMGEEPPPKLPIEDQELFDSMFVASNRTETIAKQINGIPIWFLQGTEDEPCPIEETRQLVSELQQIGGNPIFTEFEGIDHDSLGMGLEQEGVFEWMLAI